MPKISKKQLKERKKWFSEWILNINRKIENWISSMNKDVQEKFDFSIDSLDFVEYDMLNRFKSSKDYRDKSNTEIFDLYGTYIGETLRKNHCIKLTWDCDFDNMEYDDSVSFHPYLISDYVNCGHTINMAYIIHQRTGDKLSQQWKFAEERFLKAKEQAEIREDTFVIEDKGYSYQYFMLCKNIAFNINDLKKEIGMFTELNNSFIVTTNNKNHLILKRNDNYSFHFHIDKSPDVVAESKEIAESYEGKIDSSIISNCALRIEFWGDEDINGDFFNSSLNILEHMNKNKDLFLYDIKNGCFLDDK